jgi:hypothetical protein
VSACGSGHRRASVGQILETVNLWITEQNVDPARTRVVDDVRDVVVFEERLFPGSSTPISLCPNASSALT